MLVLAWGSHGIMWPGLEGEGVGTDFHLCHSDWLKLPVACYLL